MRRTFNKCMLDVQSFILKRVPTHFEHRWSLRCVSFSARTTWHLHRAKTDARLVFRCVRTRFLFYKCQPASVSSGPSKASKHRTRLICVWLSHGHTLHYASRISRDRRDRRDLNIDGYFPFILYKNLPIRAFRWVGVFSNDSIILFDTKCWWTNVNVR